MTETSPLPADGSGPVVDEHQARIGEVLQSRYRIVAHVADGGMASVYRGERLELGRPVAIKFLRSPYVSSQHFMKRFEREARALSRLSHPHCVSVFDFGFANAPYLVMDYVTGMTLRDLLDRGRLSTARALRIMRQILAGLAHAHGQGIVHRDIKPANAILTEATGTGDFVRLLDFGLAKLRSSGGSGISRVTDIVVGTPSYMSPEQSRGDHVDPRSDVYSAGVLMFELLTGHKPFASDDAFEVLTMQRESPLPPLHEAAPDRRYSRELQRVLSKSTHKDPNHRFQTAIEFLDALAEVPDTRARVRRASSGDHEEFALADTHYALYALPPSGTQRVPRAPARRVRLWVVALTLLFAAGALAATYHITRPAPESRAASARSAPSQAPTPSAATSTPTPPRTPTPTPTHTPTPTPTHTPTPALVTQDADAAQPDAGPDDDDAIEQAEILFPPDELDEPIAALSDDDTTTDEEVDPPNAGTDDDDLDGDPDGDLDDDTDTAAAIEAPTALSPATAALTATAPVAPPAVTVRTVEDVKALLAAGRRDEAVSGLRKLRHRYPTSAYIPYLLGNIYFEQKWWSAGLEVYADAIANGSSYRKRATLNKNVIRALGSRKTHRAAARFIRKRLGRSALPFLKRAAKRDSNPLVRKRAAQLAKQIAPSKRKAKKRKSKSRSSRRRRRR